MGELSQEQRIAEYQTLLLRCKNAGYGDRPIQIVRHYDTSPLAKSLIDAFHLIEAPNLSFRAYFNYLKTLEEFCMPRVKFGTETNYRMCNCDKKMPICYCGKGVFRKPKRKYNQRKGSKKCAATVAF